MRSTSDEEGFVVCSVGGLRGVPGVASVCSEVTALWLLIPGERDGGSGGNGAAGDVEWLRTSGIGSDGGG